MKLSVIWVGGTRDVVEFPDEPGRTNDEVLDTIAGQWQHGMVCQDCGPTLMQFKLWPSGDRLVCVSEAIAGFTTHVRTVQ